MPNYHLIVHGELLLSQSPEILENFSTFAEFKYIPNKWKGWSFTASAAFDIGDIYGDNLGLQLKVLKNSENELYTNRN